MSRFIIHGGRTISGKLRPPGNKNAVLPMLAASLLTDEPVRLSNIPLIEDVATMLELLAAVGVSVDLRGHSVTLCAKGIRKRRLDPELWDLTHNPWVVLQTVSRDRVEALLADPAFFRSVEGLVHRRRQEAETPAWFQQTHQH